jgi:hypothetical protein
LTDGCLVARFGIAITRKIDCDALEAKFFLDMSISTPFVRRFNGGTWFAAQFGQHDGDLP